MACEKEQESKKKSHDLNHECQTLFSLKLVGQKKQNYSSYCWLKNRIYVAKKLFIYVKTLESF